MSRAPDPVESFADGYTYLGVFVYREGHTAVPRSHKEGYFALGQWVEDIRGRRSDLNTRQTSELTSMADWDWRTQPQRRRTDSQYNFVDGFALLQNYVRVNGHSRVPQMVNRQTTELGNWVKTMRERYKSNGLANSEVDQIEQCPGWEWDGQFALFLDKVQQFDAFVARVGHGRVPSGYRDPGTNFSLGAWVVDQRKKFKDGALRTDRLKHLESRSAWRWG